MFQASTASMSASAVPATPLTVWPVLFKPQRCVEAGIIGLDEGVHDPSGSAYSTFGSRESRAATAASWPAGTVTRSVRGTSRLRLKRGADRGEGRELPAADAPGL